MIPYKFQQVAFGSVLLNQHIVFTIPLRHTNSPPVFVRLDYITVAQLIQCCPFVHEVLRLFAKALRHCLDHHLKLIIC